MSSIAKILANQANGKESQGPVTAEGKAHSSRNATKHGLFTKTTPLDQQERLLFDQFYQCVHVALQPQGASESYYVGHLVDQCWRLRSCLKLENDLFEYYRTYQGCQGTAGLAFAHDASQANGLGRVSRYAALFARGIRKDLVELRKLKARLVPVSLQTVAATPALVAPNCQGDASTHGSLTEDATEISPPQQPGGGIGPLPHGILATHVPLSDESHQEFEQYLESVTSDWKPDDAIKALFAELFAVTSWRLSRLSRVDAELMEHYRVYENVEGGPITAFIQDATEGRLSEQIIGRRNPATKYPEHDC